MIECWINYANVSFQINDNIFETIHFLNRTISYHPSSIAYGKHQEKKLNDDKRLILVQQQKGTNKVTYNPFS